MTVRTPIRGDKLVVINPYDDSQVGEAPLTDLAGVDGAIAIAERGYGINRDWPRWRRAEVLERVARAIAEEAESWAELIVGESGQPLKQARKEVARATITFGMCADEARRLGGQVIPFDGYAPYEGWSGWYDRAPIGVIVGITPFNAPLNLVAHKVGPAVAAGNAIIIKPSEHTPLTAFRLRKLMVTCGLPEEVFTVVLGSTPVSQALVRNRRVRMVSFTGGSAAAEAIVREAGVKRYSMELGGNAPVLVLADADVEHAVQACVSGAYWLAGQNCIGVQRIFVEAPIADNFAARFGVAVDGLRVGDPAHSDTDIGPLVSDEHADRVCRITSEAIEAGAKALRQGRRERRLLGPTVLVNTPHGCGAWRDEVFGPVVSIETFSDLNDAIAAANAAESLIHAGVFTNDRKRAEAAARLLAASGVIFNESSDFRFDGMPFGGSKYGNVGREGVPFAIREMTQPKAIINAPGR